MKLRISRIICFFIVVSHVIKAPHVIKGSDRKLGSSRPPIVAYGYDFYIHEVGLVDEAARNLSYTSPFHVSPLAKHVPGLDIGRNSAQRLPGLLYNGCILSLLGELAAQEPRGPKPSIPHFPLKGARGSLLVPPSSPATTNTEPINYKKVEKTVKLDRVI